MHENKFTLFISEQASFVNKLQMNYIYNSQLVSSIAKKILQPKKLFYNQDQIQMTLIYLDNIQHNDFDVCNRYGQKLKASLFRDKQNQVNTCILFMHGFGSNRMEAINILPFIPKQFGLCCFDFSGEGKSQGKIITYGQKQKHDIHAVLQQLRRIGFKNFVLWGRSMGATCSLNYLLQYKPFDVFLQILDSPFCSFSEVALQLTKKRISFPETLLNLGIEMVKKNCQKEENSPFLINYNKSINCNIPTIFMYNMKDEVVNYRNSETIIKNFNGHYEKIIIQENHNSSRTAKTIKIVLNLIKKYQIKKDKKKVKIQENIRSMNEKRQSEKQGEKIKLLFKKVTSPKAGINLSDSLKQSKAFDNYGIFVSSKFIQKQKKEKSNLRGLKLVRSQASVRKRPQSIEVVSADLMKYSIPGKSVNKNRLSQSTASTGFYDQSRDRGRGKVYHDFYL